MQSNTEKALKGKNAHKFYMFKNDGRRNLFRSTDTVLKIINALVGGFFWLALIAFGLGLAVMLLAFVLTFGGVGFADDNPGFQLITFVIKVLPYVLITFAAVYFTRFVMEWLFILKESRELYREGGEENQKYITIAKTIKRIKLVALFTMIIVFTAVAVIAVLFAKDNTSIETWNIILVALPVAALLINKIYSTGALIRIQPEVNLVIAERTSKKNEKRTKK